MAAYARLLSRGMREEAEDLLHSAIARWLGSNVPVECSARTASFLADAMKSIRWNTFRRAKLVRKFEGERAYREEDEETEPVELGADPSQKTEEFVYAQEVFRLCTGEDEEVQLLLLAQLDNGTPEQIKTELGWDAKKFESVRKRKRRLVIQLIAEGKLR